jgi:hypothetical protein
VGSTVIYGNKNSGGWSRKCICCVESSQAVLVSPSGIGNAYDPNARMLTVSSGINVNRRVANGM